MKQKLLDELMKVSEEEQKYLDGQGNIERQLYVNEKLEEIDRERLLRRGQLITVRPHSRFVDFPEHRHNYVEIMYVVQGSITHYIEGKELGQIYDVIQTKNNDVYWIRKPKELLIPVLKSIVTDINIDERKIEYKECIGIINRLRFNEENSLFAVERDKGLDSIIGNIYQSFDGQDIYKSIEEKIKIPIQKNTLYKVSSVQGI